MTSIEIENSSRNRECPLLWVRAFNVKDLATRLSTLTVEAAAPPAHVQTETRQLELTLGIRDAHVYFYLGRTLENFGSFALAIRKPVELGEMSPFDTGGLVRKIRPVSTWDSDRQGAYLRSATFSTVDSARNLEAYPANRLTDYLHCERPPQAGPHETWQAIPVAEIWDANNDWRCWTWEARYRAPVPTGASVVAWSCSPSQYEAVFDALLAQAPDVATHLVDTYIEGGVGVFINEIARQQLEALQ